MGLFNRHKDKRGTLGIGLADVNRTPRKTEDQDSPEQERLPRVDEETEQGMRGTNRPSQAEGER